MVAKLIYFFKVCNFKMCSKSQTYLPSLAVRLTKKTTQRDLKEVDANIDEYLKALKYSDEEIHTTKLVTDLTRFSNSVTPNKRFD